MLESYEEGIPIFRKIGINFAEKLNQWINHWRLLPIAREETTRILNSRKFKLMILVMMFPVIILLLSAGEIQPADIGIKATVRAFEISAGTNILEFWGSLPAQFLVILIASELIAGEVENETFTLLITKPLRRADILFGKLLAFIISIFLITIFPLLAYAGLITVIYKGGREGLLEILKGPFMLGEGVMLFGLLTVGCFVVMISSTTRKALYGGLSSLLALFLFDLLVPNISFLGPSFTLEYRLGLILEEGFRLMTETKIYSGDPLLTLTILIWLNVLFLAGALIALFRRELL